MALPDYNYIKYGNDSFNRRGYGFNRQEWRGMPQQRRQRIRSQWEPQVPEPPEQYSDPTYNPVTPPQNPNRDYSAHPFFDPGGSYGTDPSRTQSVAPGSSAYNNYASDTSPEGYYYGIMNEQGFGGLDARSQAAQGMYKNYARGYQAAKLKNQELWFPEYMGMQDVAANVRQLSNAQLGIDENLYGGRDRWSLRGW